MKYYTVSDGKLVLDLQEAEEGGYIVTSPLDPQLITEAETVKDAFDNARDALAALSAIAVVAAADERLGDLGDASQAESAVLAGVEGD